MDERTARPSPVPTLQRLKPWVLRKVLKRGPKSVCAATISRSAANCMTALWSGAKPGMSRMTLRV
jgi:hypothetical protein